MFSEEEHCVILTGPNMGGKSTYLRQAALIPIIAQCGSFVPAERAKIGIIDKIFARIGASDNLKEGESTFIVGMREAAHILQSATSRSLLFVDEIGRGTATADGLSVARAIVEWIVSEPKCRTLFATHYHEQTVLDEVFSGIVNCSVGSKDVDGEVTFTHQIAKGPASRSYGLEVARLAGLPADLIDRARGFLTEFEKLEQAQAKPVGRQLSFFGSNVAREIVKEKIVSPLDYSALSELKKELNALLVDDMTPREALNWIAEAKRKLI